MLLQANDTVLEIAKQAAKLTPLEQQTILTRIRIKRLKKKALTNIASPQKGLRKPSLKQIDKWKHESKKKP